MAGGKIDILVEPDLRTFPAKLAGGLQAAAGIARSAGAAIGVALTAGTVAAAAGLKQVIDLGIQYQNSLNTLQAVTGASAAQMAAAGAVAKELGSDLTLPATSAVDAAAAMTELAKGGLTVEQAMQAAKGTLQLAAAAQIDAAQAATIQSNALNTFSLSADQAGRVADVLANAANASSGEITDFADAFQQGGAVAAQFGLSIEDTATSLALLANRGIQGSDAGTLLKSSLLALTRTSKPAKDAIKELGLTVFDAKGEFVGMESLFAQLGAASERMTDKQYAQATATLFGSDAVRLAGVAASTTGAQWDEMSAAIGKSGGAADVAAAKMKGVGGAVEGVKSQLETIGLTIFSAFAEPLEAGIRKFGEFLNTAGDDLDKFVSGGGIEKFIGEAVSQLTAFGESVGVTWDGIVTFVSNGIDRLRTIAGNVASFFEPVIEGAVALFQSFRQSGGVFDTISTGVGLFADAIVFLSGVLKPIGEVIGKVLGLFADLPGPVQVAILAFLGMKALPALADALGTSIGKLITTSGPLGTILGGAIDGVLNTFSRVGGVASSATAGIRQFGDEMKVQKALAEQAGESLSTYEAAQAAFETSTLGPIEALREFRDTFVDIKEGAEAAGEPISNFGAAVGALAEQNKTIADLRDSYVGASGAVETFGERLTAAATAGAEALSDKLIGATVRAGDLLSAIPEKLSGLGGAISGALSSGLQLVSDIPGRVAAAGAALVDGLGGAASAAGEAFAGAASFIGENLGKIEEVLRAIGPGAASAFRSMGTAITSGLSSAASAVRAFGTQVATAFTGVVTAVAGIPARIAAVATSIRSAFVAIPGIVTGALAGVRTGIASFGTSVTTGIAGAFRAIPGIVTGALGAVRSGIAAFGTAIQSGLIAAFARIPTLVAGATSAFTGFASRIAGIGATIGTGMLKGLGGLVNMLGGPLGVAMIAAQIGLSLLAKSQAEASAAAAAHQQQLESLAGTLQSYSGAVTQATVNEKASQLAKDGTLAKVRDLGISVADYTQATLGNADALGRVKDQLNNHTRGLIENNNAYKSSIPQLQALGISLADLTAAAQGNGPALEKVNSAISRIADSDAQNSMKTLVESMLKAGGASAQLAKDLGISNGELEKVQDQVRLAAEAAGDFATKLDFLKQGFGGLKDGIAPTETLAKGFQGLSITASDAANSAGRAAEKINGVAAGADAAAKSMATSREAFIAAATAAGVGAEQAAALADSIGLIPEAKRIEFLTNASGVAAELITIGQQIKAVPDAKSVTVNLLSEEAQKRLEAFGLTVTKLPNGQSTIDLHDEAARTKFENFVALISTTTGKMLLDADPAKSLAVLNELVTRAGGTTGVIKIDGDPVLANGKITTAVAFADGSTGRITVDANPDPATGKINVVVEYGNGQHTVITIDPRDLVTAVVDRLKQPTSSTHTINVVVNQSGNPTYQDGRIQVEGAHGMIVQGMAAGGVVGMAGGGRLSRRRLTPMSKIAQIVPPNTWRVVGDRVRDDEAFIPINSSQRSARIFEETARRMGYQVARMYADGGLATAQRQFARSVAARAMSSAVVDMSPLVREMRQLRDQILSGAGGGNTYVMPAGSNLRDLAGEVGFSERKRRRGGLRGR